MNQAYRTGCQAGRMERYYRFHAGIYDVTRWAFLFGRDRLTELLGGLKVPPSNILEVGCGTGRNLETLAGLFPQARLSGVDVSTAMLDQARKRLRRLGGRRLSLIRHDYAKALGGDFDLVVFSYSLSMMNPGWDDAIHSAYEDLREGGVIGVVDFHLTANEGFRRWMELNHVRMEGQLLPELNSCFKVIKEIRNPAYCGLWEYMLYIGAKLESAGDDGFI